MAVIGVVVVVVVVVLNIDIWGEGVCLGWSERCRCLFVEDYRVGFFLVLLEISLAPFWERGGEEEERGGETGVGGSCSPHARLNTSRSKVACDRRS